MASKLPTQLMRLGKTVEGSVTPPKALPITLSSVFRFADVDTLEQVFQGEAQGHIYTRMGNPVQDAFAELMTTCEKAEAAQSFASGMAAITMAVLSQVRTGDHILADHVLYGGTLQLLFPELERFGIEATFADLGDPDLSKHCRPNTKLLCCETITNPLMAVTDIAALAAVAHDHGAKLLVDNTFATPILCQPLTLGADIVVHSATKYICGHSDVMGGVVVADRETIQEVARIGTLYGPTLSPFDGWLLVRSLRTLDLRMRRHSDNALALAKTLQAHPKVRRVFYPGLENSPSHPVAAAQFNDQLFGGMMAIELVGGEPAAEKLVAKLDAIELIPSLAGFSTSLSYPARTSHRHMTPEALREVGIPPGLLRLSTGLEDIGDLEQELAQGLAKI